MAQRLELQSVLVDILGTNDVYFQPPPTVQMTYPCIVYSRDDIDTIHADNKPYKRKTRYQVTVIDRDPDSAIPEKVGELSLCVYDRFYAADNLNHDVYKLFF
jgi:hypothetical protein